MAWKIVPNWQAFKTVHRKRPDPRPDLRIWAEVNGWAQLHEADHLHPAKRDHRARAGRGFRGLLRLRRRDIAIAPEYLGRGTGPETFVTASVTYRGLAALANPAPGCAGGLRQALRPVRLRRAESRADHRRADATGQPVRAGRHGDHAADRGRQDHRHHRRRLRVRARRVPDRRRIDPDRRAVGAGRLTGLRAREVAGESRGSERPRTSSSADARSGEVTLRTEVARARQLAEPLSLHAARISSTKTRATARRTARRCARSPCTGRT